MMLIIHHYLLVLFKAAIDSATNIIVFVNSAMIWRIFACYLIKKYIKLDKQRIDFYKWIKFAIFCYCVLIEISGSPQQLDWIFRTWGILFGATIILHCMRAIRLFYKIATDTDGLYTTSELYRTLKNQSNDQIGKQLVNEHIKQLQASKLDILFLIHNVDNIQLSMSTAKKYNNIVSFFMYDIGKRFAFQLIDQFSNNPKFIDSLGRHANIINVIKTMCKDGHKCLNDDLLLYFNNIILIEELNAQFNSKITDKSLMKMKLKKLNASGNTKITDIGIKHMTELRELWAINNNEITDVSLRHKNIRKLNIEHNKKVTDACIQTMQNLEELNVAHTAITGTCLRRLQRLLKLNVSHTKVSNQEICDLIQLTELVAHNTKINMSGLINLVNLEILLAYSDQCMVALRHTDIFFGLTKIKQTDESLALFYYKFKPEMLTYDTFKKITTEKCTCVYMFMEDTSKKIIKPHKLWRIRNS